MKTSQNGIDLIKGFESFQALAYKCPAGVLTVGYGTTKGVYPGQTVTKQQAEQLLADHLVMDENRLNVLNATLQLNQNEWDALMSFIYNVGFPSFSFSGLRKAIERKASFEDIHSEFMKWVRAGGKVLPGLLARRQKEYELFIKQ